MSRREDLDQVEDEIGCFCSIPAFWVSLLVSLVRRSVMEWTGPYSIRDLYWNRNTPPRRCLRSAWFCEVQREQYQKPTIFRETDQASFSGVSLTPPK